MTDKMLNARRIESIIYEFVGDNYGYQEAENPAYNLTELANEIANLYKSDWQATMQIVYESDD